MIPFYKTYKKDYNYIGDILASEYKMNADERSLFYYYVGSLGLKYLNACYFNYPQTQIHNNKEVDSISREEFDKLVAIFKLQKA